MKVPEPKKLPSGNYFIQMRLNGVSVSVTRPTSKECKREAELIKAEHRAEKRVIEKENEITLRDASKNYIDKISGRLSASTIIGYKKIVNNQYKSIMDLPICKITDDVLQDAVDEECKVISKRGNKYAPKTIKAGYFFISDVLNANHIKHKTPRLPEQKRIPVQILTAEQVYSAVKGTEIELPCLLAMWMTFTISEIRGFTKSKSIVNGKISVVETVVDVDGKPVRKQCGKEEERTRTQTIPHYIMQLIDSVDGDVICPLSSQAVNKRLQRLLIKSGYPPIMSFHKLRHIAASTEAALNIPSAYIQERGGWKSDHIMKTVYTHTFTEERKAADAKVDAFFESIVSVNANENANKTK